MAEDEARALLKQAMALHSQGDIDAALAAARQATALAPSLGEAWSYLGSTLVTRKRQFADGLEALDRAAELSPDDASIQYTLGWCREFAANALHKPKRGRPHQPVTQDTDTLYALARDAFLRALLLQPDEGMRSDIEDMLDVIANATGEPWREGD